MKNIFTILSTVLMLGFRSMPACAQSCVATISTSDSITAGGTNNYTFTAVGSFGAGTTFFWAFGDGTSGSGQTVTHSYTGANTAFVVTVTVIDTPVCTATFYDTIFPGGYTSPCASYYNTTNIDTLFTLSTINTGVPPFTYLWDLPNGTTSTLPDPTYVISSTGSYTGTVIVTDSTGCADTLSYTLTNANTSGNSCQAYFYVLPDSVAGVYTAVDCSTGSSLTYEWSFGDGDTSNLQYPTHNYLVPGYYTVCLTIISANGCMSSFCDSSFYANKTGGGPMSGINVIGKTGATGIQGIQVDNTISVYPNPATTILAINAASSKIISSTIFNIDGQKVAEYGAVSLLSIDKLSAGMYLIEVQTNKGSVRSTFVKKD